MDTDIIVIAVLVLAISLDLSMRLASAAVPARRSTLTSRRALTASAARFKGRPTGSAGGDYGRHSSDMVETASPTTPDFGVRSRRPGRAS